ncbi:mechanosensitive ion channel family protein [Jannaschia sp. W003]|uniref:mechanosensitive ion channel family protein n=1 Tax=Jannaschia sp. W003 TaxID=2867012 RepID=UPI0021A5CDBD|nr:mechanosensitive ion channel family protein [Jannaschia sp. W003]UWQ20720.1 mechanosensitive ion channel family protein [Jannaschia sp. W003]
MTHARRRPPAPLAALLPLLLAALLLLAGPLRAQEDAVFEVDGLNAGLGAVPDRVDRRTPRTAIGSFLESAARKDWDAAAHLLDLRDVPEADQAREGPILARQLHVVLDRKAVLDWADLRQRPDALQALGGSQQAQAGEPRRSLLIRELDLDFAPAAILLNRVKPGEDADPVWVFPQETVADVPALYRLYGPSEFESRLPEVLLQEGFWGLMWWEILGLPIMILAAIALAWAIHRAFDTVRRSSDQAMVRGVMDALSTPAVIAGVTAFVGWSAGTIFVFSGRIDAFISPLVAIGYVLAVLMIVMNVIDAVLDNTIAPGEGVDLTTAERDEARSTATRLNAIKRIAAIVIFLVGAGIVLSTADVFRGLGLSLLASAGALTLVVGFAARNVLGNIMASLQIALNQSARVGDRIVWKEHLCYVERIHLTFVQLRDWDDTRVIVPVEEFVSETFTNWSIQDPAMLRILKFKILPDADLDALNEAFADIMRELKDGDEVGPWIADLDDVKMNITGQDVFGLDVWFYAPCTDPNNSWTVACEARERLVKAIQRMAEARGRPIFPEATPAEGA